MDGWFICKSIPKHQRKYFNVNVCHISNTNMLAKRCTKLCNDYIRLYSIYNYENLDTTKHYTDLGLVGCPSVGFQTKLVNKQLWL